MRISYLPNNVVLKDGLIVGGTRSGWLVSVSEDLVYLANLIRTKTWSPIIWKGCRRLADNFMKASWCVLDIDDPGSPSLEEACRMFCDTTHIIGTTKSHQKEKHGAVCDRYRLLIPFEETITDLETYVSSMRHAFKQHPYADTQCVDGARMFLPCTSIVSVNRDGDYAQPIHKPTKEEKAETKAREEYFASRPVSRFVENLKKNGSTRRNADCFRAACELFRKNFSEPEIRAIIFHSVPTAADFTQREKDTLVASARKKTLGT